MATAAYGATGRGVTIGGVLSRAFAAIGAAPLLFFGTSFVLVALPSALSQAISRAALPGTVAPGTNPYSHLYMAPTFLLTLVVWWLLYMAAQALLFRATVSEIEGRPGTLGDYVAVAGRTLLPLLGLAILLSLAVWFAFLLLIVPGVILAMMWSVAAPALVIEQTGVIGAFGRSRYLTSGARWRIFGLTLLVFAIYLAISTLLGIGSIAAIGAASHTSLPAAPSTVTIIVSLVLQTAFVTIWTATQAALYVDLRDWKDGPAGERLADIFA